MKKSVILFSFIFLFSGICQTQSQFQLAVGGNGDDYGNSIIKTLEGGYIFTGVTSSFGAGSSDVYTVKLDSSGNIQWSRTVGGNNLDFSYSVIQTTDGGYAVAGFTFSFGLGNNDAYIIKLNSIGGIQWTRTVGGTDGDQAFRIIQTMDGGFATVGGTVSFGDGSSSDVYIIKLDGNGNIQWTRTVGGSVDIEGGYSIIQTSDGGYAVAGSTFSFGAGGSDVYIFKLDGNGNLQWTRTVGGFGDDGGLSITQTTDGYAVAGFTGSFGAGDFDVYIVKLDGSGNLQWTRTVGGSAEDRSYSIIQALDGGYILGGVTSSFGSGNGDVYIVKLDASGNTCGNTFSGGTTGIGGISGSGGVVGSGGVTGSGGAVGSGGTVTTICVIGIQPISNEIPSSYELYQNYPNPFNPTTKIRFSIPPYKGGEVDVSFIIYDALGREVAVLVNEHLKPGSYEVDWDGTNYPSGVYFYGLITEGPSTGSGRGFVDTKKMVLMK